MDRSPSIQELLWHFLLNRDLDNGGRTKTPRDHDTTRIRPPLQYAVRADRFRFFGLYCDMQGNFDRPQCWRYFHLAEYQASLGFGLRRRTKAFSTTVRADRFPTKGGIPNRGEHRRMKHLLWDHHGNSRLHKRLLRVCPDPCGKVSRFPNWKNYGRTPDPCKPIAPWIDQLRQGAASRVRGSKF